MQDRPQQMRGPMQDLRAGPLRAVLYYVIVLNQPCYDLFEKFSCMNVRKQDEYLEFICMQMISQSILFICRGVGMANVSPNYVHIYD